MNPTNLTFQQAQLAEAAYSDFIDRKTGVLYAESEDIQAALIDKDFSQTQADSFVANWRVLDQYTAPAAVLGVGGTGFSATLFQNTETGACTLAIRGTDPGYADLIGADIGDIVLDGIAMDQVVDLYNYWQRINTSAGASYAAARFETNSLESAQLNLLRLAGGPVYDAYLAALKQSGAILDTNVSGAILVRRIVRDASSTLFAGSTLAYGSGTLAGPPPTLDVVL